MSTSAQTKCERFWGERLSRVSSSYGIFDDNDVVLTATWTPGGGIEIMSSDLPETWHRSLERVGHDLLVRHFNGTIAHIRFEAMHDRWSDGVWMSTNITPAGSVPNGLAHSGGGAPVYGDEDVITVSCADLVQDQIARIGIMWPQARAGGFLTPAVIDGVATWTCRDAEHERIGSLSALT